MKQIAKISSKFVVKVQDRVYYFDGSFWVIMDKVGDDNLFDYRMKAKKTCFSNRASI